MRVRVLLNILVIGVILMVALLAAGISFNGLYQILPVLALVLIGIYFLYYSIIRRWLIRPLETLRYRALEFTADETSLGEQIALPSIRELRDLTAAFNQLSVKLREQRDAQEARIAERTQELVSSQNLIQNVLNLTPSGLCLLDVEQNRFVIVNEQMSRIFDIPADQFLHYGQEMMVQTIHPEDLHLYHEMVDSLSQLGDGEMSEARYRIKNGSGSYRWILFRGKITEKCAGGNPKMILLVAEDVTDAHFAEERLRYTSTHDMLTGLYNWAFFGEAVSRIRQSQEKESYPASFIMMDVDNLKMINDSIGHAAGDELLRRIGGILMSSFRDVDVVARVGGDEFAALLPGAGVEDLPEILQRISGRLREATLVAGVRLDVLSIGASTAETPAGLDAAREQADHNMYLDKQRRKSN